MRDPSDGDIQEDPAVLIGKIVPYVHRAESATCVDGSVKGIQGLLSNHGGVGEPAAEKARKDVTNAIVSGGCNSATAGVVGAVRIEGEGVSSRGQGPATVLTAMVERKDRESEQESKKDGRLEGRKEAAVTGGGVDGEDVGPRSVRKIEEERKLLY